jgi:Zn-finger nucleic acid-binding protein
VLPAGIAIGVGHGYFEDSALTPEEKADGNLQVARIAHGLADETLEPGVLRDVLAPLRADPSDPEAIQFNLQGTNIRVKQPEKTTPDELRAFIAMARETADSNSLPPHPAAVRPFGRAAEGDRRGPEPHDRSRGRGARGSGDRDPGRRPPRSPAPRPPKNRPPERVTRTPSHPPEPEPSMRELLISCPKDGEPMNRVTLGAVAVDRCPVCVRRGLAGRGRVGEDPGRARSTTPARWTRLDSIGVKEPIVRPQPLECPRDHHRMSVHHDPKQKHVEYDLCTKCGGMFFDAGELSDLTEFTLGERVKSLLG